MFVTWGVHHGSPLFMMILLLLDMFRDFSAWQVCQVALFALSLQDTGWQQSLGNAQDRAFTFRSGSERRVLVRCSVGDLGTCQSPGSPRKTQGLVWNLYTAQGGYD